MRSGLCASRNSRASRRAVGRFAAATESSRSRISASTPLSMPRANFRSLSAGTNSIERMSSSYSNRHSGIAKGEAEIHEHRSLEMDSGLAAARRPGMTKGLHRFCLHQRGAAADRDLLAALVQADMLELDDAGIRTRFAAPRRDHRRARPDRVAVKHRLREAHIAHAEIGDGRAQCRVADRHADDETQGEDAVDERPAEFGRAREFSVEMQRLRVHRQCREQHIVHLGDSARHRMLEHLPLGELLEIEACHPSPPADYWPPIIGRRLLALEYGTALFVESGDRLLVILGEGATRLM